MTEITLTPTTARNIRILAAARGKPVSERHLNTRSLSRMLQNDAPLAQMTAREGHSNPHFVLTPYGWSIARALPAVLPACKFTVTLTTEQRLLMVDSDQTDQPGATA